MNVPRAGKLWIAAVLAAVVALGLVASSSGSRGATEAGERGGAGGIKLTDLGDFDSPVYATTAPGKASRNLVFVVEQPGTVRVIRRGKVLPQPFFDISDRIAFAGEQGLLSIAFAPDYAETRRLYAYYTGINGDIRVSQMRRSADSKVRVSPKSLRKVIQIPHRDAPNHNGGQVSFGPDGNLWLATGDGGGSCDPDGNAQNPESLLGKLLRISPGKRGGYSIPAGNPFADGPGADEVYAIGLRNPFRFSFDDPTGTIVIGDVGQGAIEEVDYERLEDLRGANFGWDVFEGNLSPAGGCPRSDYPAPADHSVPIHEYAHSGGEFTGCSITGGLVVRDERLTALNGRYIFSDVCNGEVRSLTPELTGAVDERSAGLSVESPTSFTEGRSNRVYVTSLAGDVFRLDPASGAKRAAAREPGGSKPGGGRRTGDGRGGFRLTSMGEFDSPTYVTGPKGADGLLFVVEQGGQIRVIRNGKKLKRPFLDIRNKVLEFSERGMLSAAFSPTYGRDGLFYVYYTDREGDIVVEEYRRSKKSATDANEASGRVVIKVEHSLEDNHNGGQLQFGPDGNLYFATGDGGGTGDAPENAQNKNVLLGKLIRIDPSRNGGKAYSIPSSNPFVGKDGQDEVLAYGLRNPFRFSFDRKSGRIAIGDVGQERYEEIDYGTVKGIAGANFGWDALEGKHPYGGPDESPRPTNPRPPIFEYSHDGGGCAVIGGYVSRFGGIGSLYGRYLYADLCTGEIRSLIPGLERARGDRGVGLPDQPGISSFGEDTKGRLYFTNTSTGELKAIRPRGKKK